MKKWTEQINQSEQLNTTGTGEAKEKAGQLLHSAEEVVDLDCLHVSYNNNNKASLMY